MEFLEEVSPRYTNVQEDTFRSFVLGQTLLR